MREFYLVSYKIFIELGMIMNHPEIAEYRRENHILVYHQRFQCLDCSSCYYGTFKNIDDLYFLNYNHILVVIGLENIHMQAFPSVGRDSNFQGKVDLDK